MQLIFLYLLTILAGTTLTVQAGINSQLQQHWAHSPVVASFVSFFFGTLGLGVYLLLTRTPIPGLPEKITPWHWMGGFLGAYLVTVMVYVAPRLGATTTVALVLAGQVGVSLALDHFGLIGYAERSMTWPRFAGALMVAAGVFIIRRF